jgi:hypothetical protein
VQNFEAFLMYANAGHQMRRHRRDAAVAVGNGLGFAMSGYLWLGPPKVSLFVCLIMLGFWVAFVDGTFKGYYRRADLKRRSKDPTADRVRERIAEFDDFREKRTLGGRFHPKVKRKVEDCASIYHQIVDMVGSESWKQANPGSDWAKVGEDARQAASSAMMRVVDACAGAYRAKGMARRAWQAEDATQALTKLAVIEADLRQLADALGARSTGGTRSIEEVLSTVGEIRRAEEELDASIQA